MIWEIPETDFGAAAQRKRWAALKQGSAAKASPAKAVSVKKRKLSAAGRRRIIAATKKRWATYHAKKRAAGKRRWRLRKLDEFAPYASV